MSKRAGYIALIAVWAASLPLTLAMIYFATQLSGRDLVRNTTALGISSRDIITKLLLVIALWGVMYLFLGWIPLLVLHASKPKGIKR